MAKIRTGRQTATLRRAPRMVKEAAPVAVAPTKKETYRVIKRKRQETDDTGSWWDVAMLPFRLVVFVVFSAPVMWLLGVALGLLLAPFIIMVMAVKALAIVALFSAFLRPQR